MYWIFFQDHCCCVDSWIFLLILSTDNNAGRIYLVACCHQTKHLSMVKCFHGVYICVWLDNFPLSLALSLSIYIYTSVILLPACAVWRHNFKGTNMEFQKTLCMYNNENGPTINYCPLEKLMYNNPLYIYIVPMVNQTQLHVYSCCGKKIMLSSSQSILHSLPHTGNPITWNCWKSFWTWKQWT